MRLLWLWLWLWLRLRLRLRLVLGLWLLGLMWWLLLKLWLWGWRRLNGPVLWHQHRRWLPLVLKGALRRCALTAWATVRRHGGRAIHAPLFDRPEVN